ncbi:hypothetical protein PR048_019791 [Dryococelus australis]|uniref:HTH CENPB-type domain-containing protein n=1 Tax=Dryococelus australis TaxID=614101 RepID=A0ABQ9H4G7_9NEOP|nr:hypothetical protein PR048_019791 [Dryococelus australis]
MTKREYRTWTEMEMAMARASYRNGDMGFNECCRQYNIEKALRQEECSFQIAELNEIPHSFNRLTEMAGKKWFCAFKARHKELALRQPESTSMVRAKGVNKKNVVGCFDILEIVIDENKFDATRVFNVDETDFRTVQKKMPESVGYEKKVSGGSYCKWRISSANLEENERHSDENETDTPSCKLTENLSDPTGSEIISPNDRPTQQKMISKLNVSIEVISPIQTCPNHVSTPARRGAQGAVVLTSSPYKPDSKSTKGKGRSACANKRLRTTPDNNAPPTSFASNHEVGRDTPTNHLKDEKSRFLESNLDSLTRADVATNKTTDAAEPTVKCNETKSAPSFPLADECARLRPSVSCNRAVKGTQSTLITPRRLSALVEPPALVRDPSAETYQHRTITPRSLPFYYRVHRSSGGLLLISPPRAITRVIRKIQLQPNMDLARASEKAYLDDNIEGRYLPINAPNRNMPEIILPIQILSLSDAANNEIQSLFPELEAGNKRPEYAYVKIIDIQFSFCKITCSVIRSCSDNQEVGVKLLSSMNFRLPIVACSVHPVR